MTKAFSVLYDILSSNHLHTIHVYLTYRTGQSVDLTVIGNPVCILSYPVTCPLSRDQPNYGHNGTSILLMERVRRLPVELERKDLDYVI